MNRPDLKSARLWQWTALAWFVFSFLVSVVLQVTAWHASRKKP